MSVEEFKDADELPLDRSINRVGQKAVSASGISMTINEARQIL